jgi:predicted dehydrogenase
MINVGILGAGNIARIHMRAYEHLAQARVVAIDDVDITRATTMAAGCGARAYADWDAFLRDPDVAMVDVCLPTYLHAQAVVAAAEAGKHVLSEKPIALTLAEVDQMRSAVAGAGVQAMVAQVIRFWPGYLMIKEMIERGELGKLLAVHAGRLGRLAHWSSWFNKPDLSGGALFDLHIHDLDWLYYLFGQPDSVYAIGVQAESGSWNLVLSSLNYAEVKVTVEASLCMPEGFPFTMLFQVLGDKGYAEYRVGGAQSDPAAASKAQSLVIYPSGQPPQYPACSDADPYLAEIACFVDCLERGAAPSLATLDQARDVLAIDLAIRESLETGLAVPLRRRE